MKRSWILIIAILGLLSPGATQAAAGKIEFKMLTGWWSSLPAQAQAGPAAGEVGRTQGSLYGLKLINGDCITLVRNERSAPILEGSRKAGYPITACGFYDPAARTLDVYFYRIDGRWSSWCESHRRMDTCVEEPTTPASGEGGIATP